MLGDFVTTTDGSGIVHIAPAFGEDDYQLGLKYDLPFLQPVDKAGAFTAEVTPWAGQFVKDADKSIIIDLKKRGVLNRSEPSPGNIRTAGAANRLCSITAASRGTSRPPRSKTA